MKEIRIYILVFVMITLSTSIVSLFIMKSSVDKTDDTYEMKINQFKEDYWYYEIYKDSRMVIRQQTIPGVSGKQFFKTKEDAEKIGFLVTDKLKSGLLPIISIDELYQYDITFEK